MAQDDGTRGTIDPAGPVSAGSRLPGTPDPMARLTGSSGNQITADHWGPVDGQLAILQHGGGQTRHAWKGTGEKLAAAGFRAWALDARGHGDSEWSADGDYSQDAMIADLVAVTAGIGEHDGGDSWHSPVLVGASMGGGVSLLAAGERALDARALVMVDTAPRIEQAGVKRIRSFMRARPEGFGSLDEVADAIAEYQPQRARPKGTDGLAKNVRLGEDGRYRWHWDPAFMSTRRDMKERVTRGEAAAAALTAPTLLVRGGLSDVLSEEGAQSFRDVCTHAEYVNVTDAAHMVAGDRNDVFASAVIDFLDTLT